MTAESLDVRGLRKVFGGVVALAGIDLSISCDEILGLVGPNGSGKTTLFNVVTGSIPATTGRVQWQGQGIGSAAPRGGTSLDEVGRADRLEGVGPLARRHFCVGEGRAWLAAAGPVPGIVAGVTTNSGTSSALDLACANTFPPLHGAFTICAGQPSRSVSWKLLEREAQQPEHVAPSRLES